MKKNLVEGNIKNIIINLALPIIGSSFLQMAYGLVDMMWIGKLGSEAVAGVGTAGFVINIGFAINTLIITGTGVIVSHCMGRKDEEGAKEYIRNGFTLNFITSILLFASIIIFSSKIIEFFKLTPHVGEYAKTYMYIIGFGFLFKFNNFLFSRVLNSYGESKLPFKINLIGVTLNLILDPLFIFTFKLGVGGAAIATVIAELISMIIFIKYSRNFFILKKYFSLKTAYLKNIFFLGYPLAIQRILFTGFAIIIGRMVASLGTDAIAGQKIAGQIESISYMTIGGVHGAVSSFIGQNYGAKQYNRLKEGYIIALKLALALGGITTGIFLAFPEFLSKFFVNSLGTIEVSSNYLKIVGLSQIFMCFEIVSNGVFNGMGMPKTPSVISIIFTSIRIPMAYFLMNYFGLNGIWISMTISSIIKGILSPCLCWYNIKKLEKKGV